MNGMTDFEKLIYKEVQATRTDVSDMKKDIAVLKVRSGLLGMIGGAIVLGTGKVVTLMGWFKS